MISSSILKIKLKNGFIVKEYSEEIGRELLTEFEFCSVPDEIFDDPDEIVEKTSELLLNQFPIINETTGKIYCIYNEEVTPKNQRRFLDDYLNLINPIIRVMRLYKEGAVCMPMSYLTGFDKNTEIYMKNYSGENLSQKLVFTLSDMELRDFQDFIDKIKCLSQKSISN